MSKSSNATARAEARRRSRAAARERAERGEELQELEAPALQPSVAQAAPGGVGFRAAFRGSFGIAPIREDLRHLPKLLRSRAFIVPLVVIAATSVIAVQPGILTSSWAQLAVQSILLPPAFVVAFMAGMLTHRGSWLLGGIFGIISYVGSLIVGSVADLSVLDATNPVAAMLTSNATHLKDGGTIFGDFYGVAVSGIFAGAFAGWYGRFLRSMTPARPSSRDLRRRDAAQRKGGGRR
jgi:hypothetical protein